MADRTWYLVERATGTVVSHSTAQVEPFPWSELYLVTATPRPDELDRYVGWLES